MKKMISVVLCVALAITLLTACSKKNNGSSESIADSTSQSVADSSSSSESEPAETGMNLTDVVTAIEETAPVSMGQELSPSIEGSDSYMTDLYGLDLSTVEDYYGKMSMVNVKSDVILLVKAVPGQADAVKAALEARRDAIAASFEMYLTSEYDKATNGRVVVKGDYVLLVIAGDSDRIAEGDVEGVYAEIDQAIDAALK